MSQSPPPVAQTAKSVYVPVQVAVMVGEADTVVICAWHVWNLRSSTTKTSLKTQAERQHMLK